MAYLSLQKKIQYSQQIIADHYALLERSAECWDIISRRHMDIEKAERDYQRHCHVEDEKTKTFIISDLNTILQDNTGPSYYETRRDPHIQWVKLCIQGLLSTQAKQAQGIHELYRIFTTQCSKGAKSTLQKQLRLHFSKPESEQNEILIKLNRITYRLKKKVRGTQLTYYLAQEMHKSRIIK